MKSERSARNQRVGAPALKNQRLGAQDSAGPESYLQKALRKREMLMCMPPLRSRRPW
jgi:hypothetical protein